MQDAAALHLVHGDLSKVELVMLAAVAAAAMAAAAIGALLCELAARLRVALL